MSKKKYWVSIPIRGTITCEVEAEDQEQAIEQAFELYHEDGYQDGKFKEEWETWESEYLGFTVEVSE